MLISPATKITIVCEQLRAWRSLLWQGVVLNAEIGVSVQDLLVGGLGIDEAIVKNRIRTVFLNRRPVDDLNSAIVSQHAQIGLGGAAPGIVGIAMRRQSPVGFMRQDITHQGANPAAIRKPGQITIKLFSDVAELIAPLILKRGIIIEAPRLNAFLADMTGVHKVYLDDKTITLAELSKHLRGYQHSDPAYVCLKVISTDDSPCD